MSVARGFVSTSRPVSPVSGGGVERRWQVRGIVEAFWHIVASAHVCVCVVVQFGGGERLCASQTTLPALRASPYTQSAASMRVRARGGCRSAATRSPGPSPSRVDAGGMPSRAGPQPSPTLAMWRAAVRADAELAAQLVAPETITTVYAVDDDDDGASALGEHSFQSQIEVSCCHGAARDARARSMYVTHSRAPHSCWD